MLAFEPGLRGHGKALHALYMPLFILESSTAHLQLVESATAFSLHVVLEYTRLIHLHVDKDGLPLGPLVPTQRTGSFDPRE